MARVEHAEQQNKQRKRRRKKKFLIIFILLLLVCAAAASAKLWYDHVNDSLNITFNAENPKLEYAGEYTAADFIESAVGDVTVRDVTVTETETDDSTDIDNSSTDAVQNEESNSDSSSIDAAANIEDNSDASAETETSDSEEESEVTPESFTLNTDEAGEHELVYTVQTGVFHDRMTVSKEYTFTYSVEIHDEEAPVVLNSGNGATIEIGTEFNIDDIVGYGDNLDPAPSITVDGDVDTDTAGIYNLHATLTDFSGNSTEWDLSVEVVEELPGWEDNMTRIDFDDFKELHEGEGAFGIDVSEFQDDVDFEAVKEAGVEFVFIRIGYAKEGEVTMDACFEQNYERARAAGLKIGLYLYTYDNNKTDVAATADWIIDKLGGDSLDLPIAFDWESFTHFQKYNVSFTKLNELYDVFAAELATAGYDCILYGSKYYMENVWTDTDVRPVWLAHYTDETDYGGPYRFWQASCTGRISGIAGDVDLDIMYEQ